MRHIYVEGIYGLGDTLFQIATAVHYQDVCGGEIILCDNERIRFGTSHSFGRTKTFREKGKKIPYTHTIFKWFRTYRMPRRFTCAHHDGDATEIRPLEENEHILIHGSCQSQVLYRPYIRAIPRYLCLDDETIRTYLQDKYPNIEEGIMVGWDRVRTPQIYSHALSMIRQQGISLEHLFVVSDTSNVCLGTEMCDLFQLYAGMMCRYYLIGESVFHLWVAYLGTIDNARDKRVFVFDNSYVTNHALALDDWIQIITD